MYKDIVMLIACLWVTACGAHNERYYSLHPKLLQRVIEKCPVEAPAGISCEQLRQVALQINESAYQLRIDPQGYGKQILSLQELIAKQESSLRDKPHETSLQVSLVENKRILRQRLAIVKWLESPEG